MDEVFIQRVSKILCSMFDGHAIPQLRIHEVMRRDGLRKLDMTEEVKLRYRDAVEMVRTRFEIRCVSNGRICRYEIDPENRAKLQQYANWAAVNEVI